MTDKQIIIDGVPVQDCKFYALQEHYDIESDGLWKVCYSKDCKYSICANNPDCYYKQLKRKEQECEELKNIINEAKNSKLDLNSFFAIEATVGEYQLELDQLKAEVKSKTEYIQEQRDIINQYSKEIEMYKKCQGKRASKREEELKAENKHLNDLLNQALKDYEKARETLTEIKEIARVNSINTCWTAINLCADCDEIKECGLQSPFEKLKAIIQKISECEGNDGL